MTFDEWWDEQETRFKHSNLREEIYDVWVSAMNDGYQRGVAAFQEAVKLEREECAGICHAEYMVFEHGTERDDPQDDYVAYLQSSVAKKLRDMILKRPNPTLNRTGR